jgi:hypothetical protein
MKIKNKKEMFWAKTTTYSFHVRKTAVFIPVRYRQCGRQELNQNNIRMLTLTPQKNKNNSNGKL